MNPLDSRRWKLCGRANADRIARRLHEDTENNFSVVKTGCPLQPIKVVPQSDSDPARSELDIVVL